MTLEDIERYQIEIEQFISKLEDKFTLRLNALSKQMYSTIQKTIVDKLEVDKDGNITLSAHNMRIVGELNNVFKSIDFTQTAKKTIADYLTIINAASPYFRLFGIAADTIKDIEAQMLPRMKARAKIFNNMSIGRKEAINDRKVLVRMMTKGKSFEELKKEVKQWYVKDNRAMANIQTELRDAFMEGDRWVTHEMTKEFNLDKYYLYTGGLVNRSRNFCATKNRQAFKRTEVMKWKNEKWQGKSIPYNPFINVGGYNCRHRLMPISEQMYNRIKGLPSDVTEPINTKKNTTTS